VFGGGSSLQLFKLFGFRVGVHYSWFAILFLWILLLRESFERAIVGDVAGFLPAVVSAFLIAFTTSFDEYAVASFVVGTRVTFPIYLYSALRFPNQLPQVIAVAVVVLVVSLGVVIAAELGRRFAERRFAA